MRVRWVDRVTSTNAVLLNEATVHGEALAAREQTAGRGRMGRVWEGDPGNLMMSVFLRPRLTPGQLPLLTLGAGVVLTQLLGDPFRLKWPNDILDTQGGKVAGILAEAEWRAGVLHAVVVGVGVNLVSIPHSGATSVREHGRELDREALAEGVRLGLTDLDVTTVLDRWRRLNCTLGREVTIGRVSGRAVDLDVDGALLVRTSDGVERVVSGDLGFDGGGAGRQGSSDA